MEQDHRVLLCFTLVTEPRDLALSIACSCNRFDVQPLDARGRLPSHCCMESLSHLSAVLLNSRNVGLCYILCGTIRWGPAETSIV